MARRLLISDRLADRVDAAVAWLRAQDRAAAVRVVGPSVEAAATPLRAAVDRGAAFGWSRHTLSGLAWTLAAPELARRGLAPAAPHTLEAACARVIALLSEAGQLGRLEAVAAFPGLPRALWRTLRELRLAGVPRVRVPEHLLAAYVALDAVLEGSGVADRATVLRTALEVLRADPERLPAAPTLLFELTVRTRLEEEMLAAVVRTSVLATSTTGDLRTHRALAAALRVGPSRHPAPGEESLARLQRHLFAEDSPAPRPLDDTVRLVSAPGEERECVELVRLIHEFAARGVPLDRVAIALRAPGAYRAPVAEALRRGGLPAHFAGGTTEPDPSGRALLALLACRAEGLSAARFAEYLSLGEAAPREHLAAWVGPEQSPGDAPQAEPLAEDPADAARVAPRRWERLLVAAAVIGGQDRWRRRLAGYGAELDARAALAVEGSPEHEAARRRRADLDDLIAFALPLVDRLAALPAAAPWRVWLDDLEALSRAALRRPERVLTVLAGLRPLDELGPIDLAEVRLALTPRLVDLSAPEAARRHGRVFVTAIDDLRGLEFDVVLAPGLAERVFPQRVAEDPLLLDAERAPLADRGVETNEERAAEERLALRLAVGAARRAVVLSWPRLDVDQARPRVPSFYGLEVLRAAEGALPGFDELQRRAAERTRASLAWPAPDRPEAAIDEAEHDLSLVAPIVRDPSGRRAGALAYLVGANPHLARALRARARRWSVRAWTGADGLVEPRGGAAAAIAALDPARTPYSATALQLLSRCPYRFLLSAVHRLAPRERPGAAESLDARTRGRLAHEVQFEVLSTMRASDALPLRPDALPAALARLDQALDTAAERWREALAPSLERVWQDGVERVRADLREWLRRLSEEARWAPWRFELAFGLPVAQGHDPASSEDPVEIAPGLLLRGAIDLVERDPSGALRVTDYKSGRASASEDLRVGGGEVLQPALYALVVERLLGEGPVRSGRLWFTTLAGGFASHEVPLDTRTREHVAQVAALARDRIARGDLPAAPRTNACVGCEFRAVCGPHEERRVARKAALPDLAAVRGLR